MKESGIQNKYTPTVELQKAFFKSGVTQDYNFRIDQLKKLYELVHANEPQILEAIHKDLHKSYFEGWTVEIGVIKQELKLAIKNLHKWMRAKKLPTPLIHAIGSSWQYPEPYGNTLVIAPWNYPFMLALRPAIGAISAGNTVIIKPSEISENTSTLLKTLINENFTLEFLHVIQADVIGTTQLLENHFNYIFFTGSPQVGKIIYQAAAKNFTPVTLELGGKNPCIVDEKVNMHVAANRITWGKFSNAGQTCVAPDYLLVHASIKDKLIKLLIKTIRNYYGENPQKSPDYGRIINTHHFERLQNLLQNHKVLFGGTADANDKYIAPTIIEVENTDTLLMQSEIFGPLLPVIAYNSIEEAIQI
ncbi:MAG: aldehyde dehydrogenase family protein, partial [Chitinophagales bacterium]